MQDMRKLTILLLWGIFTSPPLPLGFKGGILNKPETQLDAEDIYFLLISVISKIVTNFTI